MSAGIDDYVRQIDEYLKSVLKGDICLYSVEDVGSAQFPKIIVTLDKKGGVSVEECTEVHTLIMKRFRDEDILSLFSLEISSCGLTRVLKHDWEIEKNTGKPAKLVLRNEIEGQITFEGRILGKEGNNVIIEDKNCRKISIDYDNIKKIQLVIEERKKI